MERKIVEWFSTSLYNDTEYTLPELEAVCKKAVDDYILARQAEEKQGYKYNLSWFGTPIAKITIGVGGGEYDGDSPEFKIRVYRLEINEEVQARIDKEAKEKAAVQKRKETQEANRKRKEEEEAVRMQDPEYVKMLELQKKFGKK